MIFRRNRFTVLLLMTTIAMFCSFTFRAWTKQDTLPRESLGAPVILDVNDFDVTQDEEDEKILVQHDVKMDGIVKFKGVENVAKFGRNEIVKPAEKELKEMLKMKEQLRQDDYMDNDVDDEYEEEDDDGPAKEDSGNLGQDHKQVADQSLIVQENDVHKVHLLIVAYMRTGSSMTGHILQFSPEVFYWYEPLHSLERYYVTGGNPHSGYRNKTLNEMFKASAMAGGNVSAALSCDIANIYNLTLLNHFMNYGHFGTRKFHSCFKAANSSQQWQRCALNMTNHCRRNYKVTAVKAIRLHMSRAMEAMRKDPKVKIMHLVRDPRGVLLSRHRIGYANFKMLKEEASLLCRTLAEDLRFSPAYSDPLRSRYMLVRYEDIAAVPLTYTHQLYKFMDLEPSEKVLQDVKAMTESAKKSRKCPTCVPTKLNSTEVSQAWRQNLTFQEVQTISRECADVMSILGYRENFQNEAELRDLTVSSVLPIRVK